MNATRTNIGPSRLFLLLTTLISLLTLTTASPITTPPSTQPKSQHQTRQTLTTCGTAAMGSYECLRNGQGFAVCNWGQWVDMGSVAWGTTCEGPAGSAVIVATTPPPTMLFVPYNTSACEQSTDPFSTAKAAQFNLTAGTCTSPPYGFASYFLNGTEAMVNASCALTLWAGAACDGASMVRAVEGYATCDIPEFDAQSVVLGCGA